MFTLTPLPSFNQTQLFYITLVFVLLFLIYNFLLCGTIWCYGKCYPAQNRK